jgi:hypothetical protein
MCTINRVFLELFHTSVLLLHAKLLCLVLQIEKRHHQIINTDFAGDARGAGNGGVWTAVAAEGKKGKYKDKRIRCDCCTIQRYVLALVIFSFIAWVSNSWLSSHSSFVSLACLQQHMNCRRAPSIH